MIERTYTSHDIAEFCDVAPSTVVKWMNEGRIKCHQTPGGHNRATRMAVVRFLKQFGFPVPSVLTQRLRILIVDDDEEVAGAIQKGFSLRGDVFQAETCQDGVEALIRIGKSAPALIVLDLVMPKLDGLQVCKVLRDKEETKGIKIIAISGKKAPPKPQEAGIDLFLRKPIDVFELVAEASRLLKVPVVPAEDEAAVEAGG